MIKKDAFQNLKGRRIYKFWLDEETGEISDITSCEDIYFEAVNTLAKYIGSITYGKERWFYDGNGLWYDRKQNQSLLVAELVDEIIDAVKEESDR